MAKSAGSKRPNLVLVSEETRHQCLLLAEELLRWPEVTARPMFGMRAFYRKAVVFAMLPGKRALEIPNAIAFKLADAARKTEGKKWHSLELESGRGLDGALAALNKAYTRAASPRKKRQ